jgi:hypothetical protein
MKELLPRSATAMGKRGKRDLCCGRIRRGGRNHRDPRYDLSDHVAVQNVVLRMWSWLRPPFSLECSAADCVSCQQSTVVLGGDDDGPCGSWSDDVGCVV